MAIFIEIDSKEVRENSVEDIQEQEIETYIEVEE